MLPLVGFVYCETNGLHMKEPMYIEREDKTIMITPKVSNKFKNKFKFARLVCLNYSIGTYKDGEYDEKIKKRVIINPSKISYPEESIEHHGISYKKAIKKGVEIEEAMENFVKDFELVTAIVFHNAHFHIRTLQCELMDSACYFDFGKYTIIDISSFNHDLKYPKLKELSEKFLDKKYEDKKPRFNLTIIRKVFFHLYDIL